MWIPYDLTGTLKPETPSQTIAQSKADATPRDVLIGFFVRNPVTQAWEIDIKADAVGGVYAALLDGVAAEIAMYGDASGKVNEIIYRLKSNDPIAALALCKRDLDERLGLWSLELGRGMEIAGWRVADPIHEARWRCTPFRPSALDLDPNGTQPVDEDLRPLVDQYRRIRNAVDPTWRLLNAFAILLRWHKRQAPFEHVRSSTKHMITFDMLVHSGALACVPDLRDQPVGALVNALKPFREQALQQLGAGQEDVHNGAPEHDPLTIARLASLADLAAREVLLGEIVSRRMPAIAIAS